jgi:hypothetical protein
VQKVLDETRKIGVDCSAGAAGKGLAVLDELAFAHRFDDDSFRVLPDRLATTLDAADADLLTRLRAVLDAATVAPAAPAGGQPPALDVAALAKAVETLLEEPLVTTVFHGGGLADTFRLRGRVLFDALYRLYILRRRIAVDLAEIIGGLQTLHALEWLAIDRFLDDAAGRLPTLDANEKALLAWLEEWVPELQPHGLRANAAPEVVGSREALARLLAATPIVHPIFAQLHRFRHPFNAIRPLGIGDLKVVKQWLVEYLPGEISHIANVLKGESNERTARRLDRTEDVFSFTGQTSQETGTDTQTTDHHELKREVESMVKSDIQLKVDSSLSVKPNAMIQIGASAGFAFARSAQDANKVAQQFAHDVVSKAVSRIQTQSTQTRSLTKTFENEETVKHTLENNKQGAAHVNGFYRFVDKRYMAQLYNFGRRLMFEFIVPEPAAFLVESRLRAFEGSTAVPTKPDPPTLEQVKMTFGPTDVDRAKWQQLRTTYDLSGLPDYPDATKTVQLVNPESSTALFAKYDLQASETQRQWWATSWLVPVDGEGFEVTTLTIGGSLYFTSNGGTGNAWKDRDFYNILLDGRALVVDEVTSGSYKAFYSPNGGTTVNPGLRIRNKQVTLALEMQNAKVFSMSVELELTLSPQGLLDYQTQIYNVVKAKEQELVDAENREALLQYQSDLGDYHRALKGLSGTAGNDLLRGESEAANRRVIDLELRRHCMAELTKEFDADRSNDAISSLETVGQWDVDVVFQKMKVTETPKPDNKVETTFGFQPEHHAAHYPATKLDQARAKGKKVQFLEQAFDWENLSYLFYPYFWATPPKWIDLVSRSDDADPTYSSFLQAGAARVLVSVSPGYEQAVMHYLATSAPWDGGDTPAIGDPLYVAIYQELRNQEDSLANATPEGEPWSFVVPTSLTYLDGGDALPSFSQTPGG